MRDAGSNGDLVVSFDDGDPDGQSLLVRYPSVVADDGYVRPMVKIESGAKSALDPHTAVTVKPYVADDMPADLSVPGVMTVDAEWTFWDKVLILHGLRRWYERRGELRGQRVSRHYYDIHCLLHSNVGTRAVVDVPMANDCVRHAQMFFNRPDLDLATAAAGTFALTPHDGMVADLRRDYAAVSTMIFGKLPAFDEVMASTMRLESTVNGSPSAAR